MGFGLRTGACKVLSKRARRACGVAAVSLAAAAAPRFSGTAFGLRPALAKSRRSGHAGLVGQLLFPSLLRRRPVSLGPLSGFARRLQSPVETGTPTRRRSEGARFSETSLVPSGPCNPGCPSSGTPGCPHGFRTAISNPAQCEPCPVKRFVAGPKASLPQSKPAPVKLTAYMLC